jgi:DNA-binding response OmpR family regulator
MRILIADDDLTSRTMLQGVLRKWGYEVCSAASGDEAWDILQGPEAPCLAILDWEMPGMDGVTLCRKLREPNHRDPLYILLLTSRSHREDIIRGLEAGADDYLTKPHDNAELRARLLAGCRMLELQAKLRAKEKLQAIVEMAGALCHELNQPFQVVAALAETLMLQLPRGGPAHEMARQIRAQVERMGEMTWKLTRVSEYRTTAYVGNAQIVDLEALTAAR